ncbi:MAG: two-component system, chemotaxis family, CheB/CheR fusion protein [Blastocatellia bacterium]|nr:two-component system, chemotaxis family, CheB/CheR fusion protein [Blastocatellia bacterium]
MSNAFADDDLFGGNGGVPGVGEDFLIVGLGASAGGIHALKEFFSQVPAASGMAYVVILHLSPDHESKLAEVLQLTSAIPVTQVQDRVRVVPDHVYVISPNRSLKMEDGHLTLSEIKRIEERRAPVDIFFRTLAESHHSRAVCVVLSGTGADGSMGMKRVKEYGGICIAQDPLEAEYSDMPRNAIATGLVDYVLPVSSIPSKITAYKEHLGSIRIPVEVQERPEADDLALREIFTQLRVRTGHDFSNYKRSTVLRRIERRISVQQLPDVSAYARYFREQPDETRALLKDLLISVTNFFRDPQSFVALEQKIIPRVFENKGAKDKVRVWVAGCATGEEAYSMAMLLSEYVPASHIMPGIQVFATDIDEWALNKAREGFYTLNDAADVSPERLRRFFTQEKAGYRVRQELREMVLFATHNVIKDPPFSHLDLITCRNLLIYFNRSAQERTMEVFHFALNPGGYLFLGTSESIEGSRELFVTVDKEQHVFRSRPLEARLPFLITNTSLPPQAAPNRFEESTRQARALERLSYLDLHQRLLEQYAPPSVIVNEEFDIMHLSERAGRYMQVAGGEPSRNLLKLVHPDLRLELRTALHQATQKQTNVEARALLVRAGDRAERINLIVRPVMHEEDATRGFILVLFENEEPEATAADAGGPVEMRVTPSEPIARQLEEELIHAKAQLRMTVEQHEMQQEELKASNEELQAMNEELRSSAEELETSKEELQSVNEELTTVNQELKIKIEELGQSNNDFKNLMNSTDIGTIFLDRNLRVKLFTPRASDIFNLIPTDTGRPLADINSKLVYDRLLPDIEHVIESLQAVGREVQTQDGHWYLMRLLPYLTAENHIDGTVLTFLDITVDLSKRRQTDEERGRLMRLLVTTQEDERRRIARDLHDQMGQQLTALRLRLETIRGRVETDAEAAAQVEQTQAIAMQIESDIDFLARELRPVSLDDIGLKDTLAEYVRSWAAHYELPADFHSTGLDQQRLSPDIETNLYRIAQEALNNIYKHARATRVDVILECRDHLAVLIIEDDGVGFDPEAKTNLNHGIGLVGMRERAALVGGTLEIESTPGEGTTLFARTPATLVAEGER